MTASVTEQLAEAIAERRGARPASRSGELIDRGPFLAGQALDAGLVDTLGYRDEVYASVRQQAGEGAILLYLARYQRSRALAERARKLPRPAAARGRGRLIYATGPIRRGRSGRGPLSGGAMGSDTIAAALRAADRRRPGARPSCCGSTAPAAPTSPPTRSGARSSGPARRASRWWSRWATWPPPAATTSPWPPT